MRRYTVVFSLTVFALVAPGNRADAHCQIPCGIYHDHDRVKMMREDVETITKAVGQIRALSGKRDARSQNQLTRWIMTKEQHAERMIRVISDYFMAQKIKPAAPNDRRGFASYQQRLTRHHAVMVAAMKCKQSASMTEVKALGRAVDAVAGYWKK